MDGGAQFTSSGKRSYLSNEEDLAEHSGRQTKRKDTSTTATSVETEYRILCPADKIGSLIGKGGSIIKSLRQECRSKIRVEDPIPGSDERVIHISSLSKDNRHEDSVEIQSLCPAQEALFRVHARIVEIGAVDDDEDEPPRPVIARLLVPNVQIGCVLGKGGKIIEQMRREIGAQIRVLPKEQIPAWVSSSDEMVQLSGDPALVKRALKAVSSRLYENPPRDRISGGAEGFYMPQPTPMVAGGGMYSSGTYMHQGGPFMTPAHMGGNVVGLGAFYGATGYGTAWSAALPSSYAVSTGHAGGMEDSLEEDMVLRMLCSNDKVGSLIGKGGSIIRKMREDTGAHIRVGDPIPGVDERVVEITSTEFADSLSSPGVEAALQVHNRLVELLSDKESCMSRLLVPASQIGCILGKGGSIITEIRKMTRANIRIPSKEELPKCASENDELVQISGDEGVVLDALSQVLNRLRSNLLRGGVPGQSGANYSMPGFAYMGGPIPLAYGVRYDKGAYGGFYPVANVGYQGMSYGGFGQEQGGTVARSIKESRRH
ncbi:hypothetical protein L7F22_060278 [Adiantum nelumboides]|nr:hypothetical protein [Adiantum nelumboides]